MKNLLIVLVLIILVSSFSFGDNETAIYYNNKLINFVQPTIYYEDDVLFPAKEFSELIGAQYLWNDSGKFLIIYRNNIFLKFNLNSRVAYINGNSFIIDTPIIIKDSTLYMPIDFISDYFDINVEYDKANKTLRLTNTKYNIYKTYKSYFYKTIEIPKFNISFDIPYYWELLDEEAFSYGKKSNYEDITLNVRVMKISTDLSIDEYIHT
ncbi:MAG: copper amine oxidase N-terminal domain-containing protein, partial [Clostridiales bacterium]|nr:copper amine oxidase N-terminal domain-containing protein [Clostridiales bacterium]